MDNKRVTSNNITGEDQSGSSAVLSYINQMLMEEDTEEKYNMFHDSLALQNTERSFYEVITTHNHNNHPFSFSSSSSPTRYHHESPDQSLSCSSSNLSGGYGSSCSSSAESQWRSPILPNTFPIPDDFQSSPDTDFGFFQNPLAEVLGPTFLQQFKRGVEQSKHKLTENKALSPSFTIKTEEEEERGEEGEHFLTVSRGRRNRECQEYEAGGRSRKQSAAYMDESELSELFDKVLLGTGLGKGVVPPNTTLHQSHETTLTIMFGGNVNTSDEEVLDLRTLLMLCAQTVATGSPSSARQLVKQIKQNSSPIGDQNQRLAHYFGNALEARLDGTGYQLYSVLSSKRVSAKDMIKAYYVYISVCPFEKIAIMFANSYIRNLTEDAETIHIIDFGIRYGFKWPLLISHLSRRASGPPKLRITGIDKPQSGFRPEERVLETRRRLESYCRRFNVPFEFNAIATRWDTIKVEDLKIQGNEFVAVNCMFQFEHLLDETVVLNNPRDAVLRLIKKANPDIFMHSIVNGSYDVPFFVSRFRESLFHYTALFDMLDTNVARENPMRLMFEKDLFGQEIMNIIACEGLERVERPQTYKQWQLRNTRNGFKKLPQDQRVIDKLKSRLIYDKYNKNFLLEVDEDWVLQGWKGRILHASSCWIPA